MCNEDIVTTHQTFLTIESDTTEAIREGSYTLIMDESLDTITQFNNSQSVSRDVVQTIYKEDMEQLLIPESFITIDPNDHDKVKWNHDKGSGEKFRAAKELADLGRLYSANGVELLCVFPPELFKDGVFKDVYILTYMFNGCLLKHYFDVFSIEYKLLSLSDGELVEYDEVLYKPYIDRYRELITVVTPDLDKPNVNIKRLFAFKKNSFGKDWCKKLSKAECKRIRDNTSHFFRRVAAADKDDKLWTCYQDYQGRFEAAGYKTAFLSCNARATNDYADKHVLAYLCNMNINPLIKNWINRNGGHFDDNAYTLSCLIQWMFRSAIRKDEQITIYIPSNRVRELLLAWLE